MKAVVVEQDLVTAWGVGASACWRGILSGKPAFSPVERFNTQAFQAHIAALVSGLDAGAADSLVMQMLKPLLAPLAGRLPDGTLVILASTTGEVDFLERHLLSGAAEDSCLDRLLGRILQVLGTRGPGRIVSAACASSSAGVAHAATLITSGARECVLVVACDAVTEFVYSGFSSLMALDPDGARPFDKSRKGLTVGEAAGYVLLMSDELARRENRRVVGEVAGWGMSCDANHMTGPSRDGGGLAYAMGQALKKAGVKPQAVGSISAHGTGTVYNDSMEIKAFGRVFAGTPKPPTYSIKGSIGHTMGAAGLVEMIMAIKSMEEQVIPPSVHLAEIDPEAEGWVTAEAVEAKDMRVVMSTNSGFGGVNVALVLKA